MKGFKNKRGISLIVLVITIIVMIILAAAIILSLNNSGIIDKANKAKKDSDVANLKDYVSVLDAEWEAKVEGTQKFSSREDYINAGLLDEYPRAALSVDGELYLGLNEVARDAIAKGIKIGERVDYIVPEKSVESKFTENGYGNKEIFNKSDYTWRYVGISDIGELLISPDVVSGTSTVPLSGKIGYLMGPEELDRLCGVLYTTDKGNARSININDINNILGYTGEKGAYYNDNGIYIPTTEEKSIEELEGKLFKINDRSTPKVNKKLEEYKSDFYYISKTNDAKEMTYSNRVDLVYYSTTYWLASQTAVSNFKKNIVEFRMRFIELKQVSANILFKSDGTETGNGLALRPIVSLKANVNKDTDENGIIWKF